MDNRIDIALTLGFDMEDFNPDEVVFQPFFQSHPQCVISRSNPLATQPDF